MLHQVHIESLTILTISHTVAGKVAAEAEADASPLDQEELKTISEMMHLNEICYR